MPSDSSTAKLLNSVSKRLRLNGTLKRFQLWVIISAAVFFVLLLVSRLLAVIPDLFSIYSLAIPLLTGLLAAVLWPVKVKITESAQAVDSFSNTDDLFLTASTLESCKGEFQGLVAEKAESEAVNIKPVKVIPLNWKKPAKTAALALAVLGLALFLPQLDPLGKEKERADKEKKNKVLAEARKETDKRLLKLKKEAKQPKESDGAKTELTKLFKEMKKTPPKKNLDKLRQKRRELARMWSDKKRQIDSEKKSLKISNQKFGSQNKELKKIAKDIKNGSTKSASKKLQEMKEDAEELAEMKDSKEKQEKIEDLKKKIEDMKDMLNDGVGSEAVKAAMDRALEQLDELSDESKQALKDAAKSLELSERELSRLQKMMDEMKDLEKMMQTASQAQQMAQQMAQNQGEKGEEDKNGPPNYESFQEYQDYFNQQAGNSGQQQQQQKCGTCEGTGKCTTCNGSGKDADGNPCPDCQGNGLCKDCNGKGTKGGGPGGKCAGCNGSGKSGEGNGQPCPDCNGSGQGQGQGQGQIAGQGQGQGTGNPGGGGGTPGENDSIETGFKKEKSKSQMQAGKTLMEWKTKGVSEKGDVKEEYNAAMQEIREGVDEAISNEKIPPGYHEVIKKYFSSEEDQPIESK